MKDLQERISQLHEAQELIREAAELIFEATEGTEHHSQAEAYTIAHLNNWAEGHNPYDFTIPKIIESMHEDNEQF